MLTLAKNARQFAEERIESRMAEKNTPSMIKKLRTRMGLTQEQFAAKVGVSFATVNRWEASKAKPSRLAMNRLAELNESLTKDT